ncbi:MAG: PQQ-dependent sugar dehydrogenase [Gammaproteobacteria bacterium]|nr:PQQ-dependent sugar dehydrogenase [Gammaproteobacteria bacterium]
MLGAGCAAAAYSEVIQTEKHRARVVNVSRGLEHPWGLAFLPDGRMLVTERAGRLRIVNPNGKLDPTPVSGLPRITASGQGGLLDVALHPKFTDNRSVYLSYAASGDRGVGTEVARGQLNGSRLTDVEVIFRALPKSAGGRHFGSRLLFDPQGRLYVTLGDRGDRRRAQDLADHAGSIVRLRDDGGVPEDNPFIRRAKAKPEIFTYGNRNVQGIALQRGTNLIWAHEHGPQGGDEVNIVRAGANYGWPVITYGRNYGIGTRIGEGSEKPGMVQPVHYWVPSIAPSGMAFYEGDKFPQWRGDLFVGALKDRLLVRLEIDGQRVVKEERMLRGVLGRIRDVRDGPDGFIYLLTDEPDGMIVRLEPLP